VGANLDGFGTLEVLPQTGQWNIDDRSVGLKHPSHCWILGS
jgi:hypothetical protein